MGKAEQRCGQAPSVAILRHDKLSRIICRGEHRSPVLRICCKFRIVGVRWDNFVSISKCCCRGLITSTSEQRSPVFRIYCKFRIVGENFLLPNLVVTVGLLLRRANSVRPCSGFAVNSELQGCGGIILFLYQNVVTVGLFLRRANGVRPYTYIELIPQVE